MMKLKSVLGFAMAAFVAWGTFAAPKVNNLKVTPIPPWGLALDYTVSGAPTAAYALRVAGIVGGSTNVAQTLVGAIDSSNGAHRVYWHMSKDGLSGKFENMSVSVRYQKPTYCVIDLSKDFATSFPVTYLTEPPPGGFNTDEYKTAKLVLKRVEPGTYIMGEDQTDESHRVTLTKAFYMGLFEVTKTQYARIAINSEFELTNHVWECDSHYYYGGKYDSDSKNPVESDSDGVYYENIRGENCATNPVISSAVDSDSFLGRLRKRTGLLFDLPTEAQWEYACRAWTTTRYSFGDVANREYMYHYNDYGDISREVGLCKPNPWGFYDMHGGVAEWCLDWGGPLPCGTDPVGQYCDNDIHVLRGGGYYDDEGNFSFSRGEIYVLDDGEGGEVVEYGAEGDAEEYAGFRLVFPAP